MTEEIKHLADFLGTEMRRRYEDFHETKNMRCWDCITVIDKLAEVYGLHWDKEKHEYEEEEKTTI